MKIPADFNNVAPIDDQQIEASNLELLNRKIKNVFEFPEQKIIRQLTQENKFSKRLPKGLLINSEQNQKLHKHIG